MRRNAIHLGLIGAFAFALALSVSPHWHERIHPNAKESQHECAITLIATGNYHQAAAVPLLDASTPILQFGKTAALTPTWVPAPFLGARIFEHAPPARS